MKKLENWKVWNFDNDKSCQSEKIWKFLQDSKTSSEKFLRKSEILKLARLGENFFKPICEFSENWSDNFWKLTFFEIAGNFWIQ